MGEIRFGLRPVAGSSVRTELGPAARGHQSTMTVGYQVVEQPGFDILAQSGTCPS